jgi:excisionase family DNA binding protein
VSGVELRLTLGSEQIREIAVAVAAILREDLAASANGPEYFGVSGAADYLAVPVGRLRKLIARHEVAFHQEALGCRITLARADLDRYLESQRLEARS